MKRPLGVVLSAVLLLLGSLFQLLLALAMALSGAFLHNQLRSGRLPDTAAMPGWMPLFMYVLCAFFLALAVWAIVTAVGLIRLRRWARYSVLVIGGCLAMIGLVSVLMTLVMMAVPLGAAYGVDPAQAHTAQAMTRIVFGVMALFYGILCAVGVSWLVYFNREKTRVVFAGTMGAVTESPRPLLISVIAVFSMIGAGSCVLISFLPIPGALFGLILTGWEKVALYLVFGALEAAIGIGLWRLEEWGRRLAILMMAIGVAQTAVYAAFPSLMLRYSEQLRLFITPEQVQQQLPFQIWIYRASFGFSVLFAIAMMVVLVHYRAAFQHPAESPRPLPPAPDAAL
jgi:uncharacterized membrane protein (DUF2068 family)